MLSEESCVVSADLSSYATERSITFSGSDIGSGGVVVKHLNIQGTDRENEFYRSRIYSTAIQH